MPQTSLTDMSAVRPKGPRIFIALLALATVAGVVWFLFLRPPGARGAEEDPVKILIVTEDAETAEFMREVGFVVDHGSLDELSSKASTIVEGLEATGPLAVLTLGDELGAGYVAFENPSALAFGDLAVSPESADITADNRWAVFSVGDFGNPHHVTVGLNERLYELPTYVELLRALFEQEKLAATLVGEDKLAIEAQSTYEAIKEATKIAGAYGLIDARARRIKRERSESLDEPEEADPKPQTIGGPLERTGGFPVANGGIVAYVDSPRIKSPRTAEAELDYKGYFGAFYLPPGKTGEADRQPCDQFVDVRSDRVFISAAGDALLRAAGDVTEIWLMPRDATGCPFVKKGTIPAGEGRLGRVTSSGRVARAVSVDEEPMVEIWNPNDKQPQVWPMSGCTDIDEPEWLDDKYFVVACHYRAPEPEDDLYADDIEQEEEQEPPPEPTGEVIPDQTWLYFTSTETGQVLAWPAWRLDENVYFPTVHRRPGPHLALLLDMSASKLELLTAATDIEGFFATPLPDDALPRPVFVPEAEAEGVAALRFDMLTRRSLTIDEGAHDMIMSPTGSHIAFEVDHQAWEEYSQNVATLDLETGKTKRAGINRWAAHESPRFTADGKTLVWGSTYWADSRDMTALRIAPVP